MKYIDLILKYEKDFCPHCHIDTHSVVVCEKNQGIVSEYGKAPRRQERPYPNIPYCILMPDAEPCNETDWAKCPLNESS